MQAKELINTESQVKYQVTISVLELNITKQEELQQIANSVTIQGFRTGKAPLSMVEIQYRSKLMTQVLDKSVNNAVDKIITDNKLNPFGTPKVNIIEYKDNSNLIFEVDIAIFPKINDVDFSKIKLNKFIIALSEEELEKSLQDVANNYKSYTDVTEERTTKSGDVVVIDFLGKVDNVAFEGGKGVDYPLTLGSNTFIPGFEEQLINKNINDAVNVAVKFPKDYQSSDLAGKDAIFEVTIKKIQTAELSKIDDSLAKKVGFASLDELKADIKNQHSKQLEYLEKNKLKTQLVDELIKQVTIKLPENILEEQRNNLWNDYLHQKEHMKSHAQKGDYEAHGHSKEEVEYYNKPEEEIKKEIELKAVKTLSISLVFDSVVKNNSLTLNNQDVMEVITQEARMYGMQPEVLLNNYQKDPNFIKQLQSKAMEDKIFNFILSKVSYNEKQVTFEEYLKQISVPNN